MWGLDSLRLHAVAITLCGGIFVQFYHGTLKRSVRIHLVSHLSFLITGGALCKDFQLSVEMFIYACLWCLKREETLPLAPNSEKWSSSLIFEMS